MMQLVNEQLGRHNLPADNVPRNLLKFLTSAVGLSEMRLFVAQKIESWIQNPKVTTNFEMHSHMCTSDGARLLFLSLSLSL